MLKDLFGSVFNPSVVDFRLKLGCSENVTQQNVTATTGNSNGSEFSTQSQIVSYNVNNIYVIGKIVNTSVVKLGESSVGKSPVPSKKNPGPLSTSPPTIVSSVTSSEASECNVSDVKPTKTRMPEYFENTASTQTTQLAFHDQSSTAINRLTDTVKITSCHCPSKIEG